MKKKLNAPRGTYDLVGRDATLFSYITNKAADVATQHGFAEARTPIFEFSEVFNRSLGEETDVVTKEMYTFADRNGESLTLRPEGTAPIVRALISNNLMQQMPWQVFYHGPMFRYERPQKGRQRQFHQFGVEYFGPTTPLADAETILLAYDTLKAFGLQNKVTLCLSTLGDINSRTAYIEVLIQYLQDNKTKLSALSQTRLEKNPLRVLDSKEPEDKPIIEQAPRLNDYLNEDSRAHYEQVKSLLKKLNIPFDETTQIVRGLDYYNHTVFEFVSNELGAQGTILAGGRYNGLVEQLGGPDISAVGWAFGIERFMLLLEAIALPQPHKICLVSADGHGFEELLRLKQKLAASNAFSLHMCYKENLGKALKYADKISADTALIMGETEVTKNNVVVKDLKSGDQETTRIDNVINVIRAKHDL